MTCFSKHFFTAMGVLFISWLLSTTSRANNEISFGKKWGTSQGWDVFFSQSGGSCFAINGRNGTVVIMGSDRTNESGYFTVSGKSWRNIGFGQSFYIDYILDKKRRWNFLSVGGSVNSYQTLNVDPVPIQFLDQVSSSSEIVIKNNGHTLGKLSLKGSRAALNSVYSCSKSLSTGKSFSNAGQQDQIDNQGDAERSDSQERLPYGSRAGMEVMVLAKSGLGTSNAVIKIELTRDNAAEFCELYLGDTSSRCVDKVMNEDGSRLRPEVMGNCTTKTWTDMYGNSYVFKGKNSSPQVDLDAEYIVQDVKTGDVLNASSASGYAVALDVFKALCPGSL